MYNTIPSVQIKDVVITDEIKYGYNSRLAVFGAFNSTTAGINVCKTSKEAKQIYGETEEFADQYFDLLFSKNNEVLIYNVNYGKETADHVITAEDIAVMQEALAYDKFDILLPLISFPLATEGNINPAIVALQVMHDEYYNNRDKCLGLIMGIDLEGAVSTDLPKFKELFQQHGIYKAITSPISLDGELYDITMNAVYNALITINNPVTTSETMMIYDSEVDGIITGELETDISIQDLIDAGFLTTQYFDRGAKTVQCISNITPSEHDMRIERSFDYIVNRINFAKILGMDNNRIAYDVLDAIVKYEKTTAIKSGLCTDMTYDIYKTGQDEVTIDLVIKFNDIIRTVKCNVDIVIE